MNNNIVIFLMKNLLKIKIYKTHKQYTNTMFTSEKSKHAAKGKKNKRYAT